MKKIKYVFALISFFLMSTFVSAATVSLSVDMPQSINAGESFNATLKVTGNNVWGITTELNYDSSKLELIGNEAQNGFTATIGKNIVLDSNSGHNGTFAAVILKFKAKSDFVAGQSTTINFGNVKASSDAELMTGTGISKTIKVNIPKSSNNNLSSLTVDGASIKNFNMNTTSYDLGTVEANKNSIIINGTAADSKATVTGTGTKTLKYGANTFNVVVKAENGSSKTYQIKITRFDPRNKDNNLSSLSINPLTISFNKTTTSYTVIAEHEVKSINIQATTSDSKATVTGTGTKTLKDYVNVFKVVVKAENETTKTYTITVNRKDSDGVLGNVSKDNTLKSLSIEGQTIKFDKNITEYNIEVDSQITKLKINAVANHAKAQIKIENNEKLVIGNNKINVIVTAESGTKKTYVINVVRKNNIPVTTLEKLNESIDKLENEKLIVEIKDENDILSKENISKIKSSKKEVTINKYNDDNKILYAFIVDGNKIENVTELNTKIEFSSTKEDEINNITNYSDSIFLDFGSKNDFLNGVKINVNVSNKYKNNDIVNIYQYNEMTNKMEEIQTGVQVIDGYVELNITNPKDTIITRATLETSLAQTIKSPKNNNIFMIIAIIESVVIIGLVTLMLLKFKNNAKLQEDITTNIQTTNVKQENQMSYEEQLRAQQSNINNIEQNTNQTGE